MTVTTNIFYLHAVDVRKEATAHEETSWTKQEGGAVEMVDGNSSGVESL